MGRPGRQFVKPLSDKCKEKLAETAEPYEMSFFISRTACSNPTMIARATMLWPMFSSPILAMAAIGRTLR